MTCDLSIVVAVYNEDPRNLVLMLERLFKVLSPLGLTYEVIFVNDGSREPTSNALMQLAREVRNVKLVILSRNFGQQAAISAGIDHARGDAVVNIDSDLQDPPELIPQMVQKWKEGYDVVYAQRSARRDRVLKRLSAFLFYRVLGALSSVGIPWDTGDFRLMDRQVVEALANMPEKTRFLRGQIPWLGFKQIGIPIERGARELGESTYTLRKLFTLAMDGLLGFSSSPLYFIAWVGVLIMVGSLLGLVGWLTFRLQAGLDPVDNLCLILSVGAFAGLQIVCMGIMASYLSKVADEVRARPTYVVKEVLGLGFVRADEIETDDLEDFAVPAEEAERARALSAGYHEAPSESLGIAGFINQP